MATPDQRKDVRTALAAAFGRARIGPFQPLVGGTSGASIYRFDVGARTYALRLEPERIALQNRQRHYACMSLASDAGAAPKVRFADAEAGVSIIDYIAGRPMAEHPAGPLGLMRALGALMMKVRAAGTFPDMGSYPELIGGLLAGLDASGQFPVGGLATHISGLARIQKALPWEASTLGPSHNDPNPRNILFDGERLWLIDWELAARNDPLTDVAILSNDLANSPESESALLEAAFGRPADRLTHVRLQVMKQLTRLFYGCIILENFTLATAPVVDEAAIATPAAFRSAVAGGRFASGSREAGYAFARMCLNTFAADLETSEFETALSLASRG